MAPTDRPLAFVGMTTIDVVQIADVLPAPNRKGRARHAYIDIGGPAANAAITASILGSPVSVHSVSGEGGLGALIDQLIDQYAVTFVLHGTEPVGPLSSIWVTSRGERTVLSTSGSFDGPPAVQVDLTEVAAVLLDGFYPHLTRSAVELAVERSIPITLDCGSWRDIFDELLPVASVAIVSEQFEMPGRPALPAESVAAELCDGYGLELAAVSRGQGSIVWRSPSAAGEIAVPTVDAIDTLGAGDVLHGAFMHFAYTKGFGLVESLERASVVASRSCEHYGTRDGVRE
jgi:sugar/nucleoside kinase (ribokinase family)